MALATGIDVQELREAHELFAGAKAGIEAAVHAMKSLLMLKIQSAFWLMLCECLKHHQQASCSGDVPRFAASLLTVPLQLLQGLWSDYVSIKLAM